MSLLPSLARVPVVALAVATIGVCTALAGCGGSDAGQKPTNTAGAAPAPTSLGPRLEAAADDLRAYWRDYLGPDYEDVRVIVPEQGADTACGRIESGATGPAYCAADRTMVLPLTFFRAAPIRANDAGRNDVAAAAVVGHEFAHHLQALAGIEEVAAEIEAEVPEYANLISVAIELNADCLMGHWLGHTGETAPIDTLDVEPVLDALNALSDDVIMKEYGLPVRAADMDHGTRTLRRGWFAEGYEAKDIAVCEGVFTDLETGDLEAMLKDEARSAAASP